jgi:hypothetical protein
VPDQPLELIVGHRGESIRFTHIEPVDKYGEAVERRPACSLNSGVQR